MASLSKFVHDLGIYVIKGRPFVGKSSKHEILHRNFENQIFLSASVRNSSEIKSVEDTQVLRSLKSYAIRNLVLIEAIEQKTNSIPCTAEMI